MKATKHGNAMLVELLIVVMFFMLAATVLLQVFAKAGDMSSLAGRQAAALAEAQNLADALYAAEDPEAELEALEFSRVDDGWESVHDDLLLRVTLQTEETGAGILFRQQITVYSGETELLSLPNVRYREVYP